MTNLMNAICVTENKRVELKRVPTPEKAEAGYVLVKMLVCGINSGDNAFIAGLFAKGSIPVSRYEIAGVSGVGMVEAVGEGVPAEYLGKAVAIYRSLKFSDAIVGTWSEKAHVHRQHCVLLPDGLDPEAYAGSLVNTITPFAFLQQIREEGHSGIIATAGTSATGLAMLGICLAYGVPLISIARDEQGKEELAALGAKNILVQTGAGFKKELAELAQSLNTTAVFDGVGGEWLNNTLDAFPQRSTIYSYGYLGGFAPLTVPLGLIMRKAFVIKSFGNFTSMTVTDPLLLDNALTALSQIIHQPHFRTKVGKGFHFHEIEEALAWSSPDGGKAILRP